MTRLRSMPQIRLKFRSLSSLLAIGRNIRIFSSKSKPSAWRRYSNLETCCSCHQAGGMPCEEKERHLRGPSPCGFENAVPVLILPEDRGRYVYQ